MSRSGYIDDDYGDGFFQRERALYRGRVASTIRGKKGQAFLKALVEALDAMPEKRLIVDELQNKKGEVCAIGALGLAKNVRMDDLDAGDADEVAKRFDISSVLAREVVYLNDECYLDRGKETPEDRWKRMRDWAKSHIKE